MHSHIDNRGMFDQMEQEQKSTRKRASGSLERVVSCVYCRHCGSHNGAQVRCKYPRERQPEVVDMTTMSGWTMASAAEICRKYEAANEKAE